MLVGEYGKACSGVRYILTGTKQRRKPRICKSFVEKPFAVKSRNFGSEQAFVGRYGMFLRESTVCGDD